MTTEGYTFPDDLSGFETNHLKSIRDGIDSELQKRADAERKNAQKLILQLANAHEINLSELSGRAIKKGSQKYLNPENCFESWNGVGRKPKWVVAALTKGKKLEDLLIPEK